MADTQTPPSSSVPSTPPSSAAEQARIRKERREAKIKAGGSARLNKISGLGGGLQREPPPPPPQASASSADPDEVDISEHFYEPVATARPRVPQPNMGMDPDNISEDQLRAMMLGFPPSSNDTGMPPPGNNPFAGPPGSNPFAGFPGLEGMGGIGGMGAGGPPSADDPIMKMMQQIMGGLPGDTAGGMPSFPGMPSMGLPGQGLASAADPYAYLWRIVHAVFALSLGLYVAATTSFTGTKLSREMSALANSTETTAWHESGIRFFYMFATTEIVLQTSRFFFEQGRVQQGGIVGMIMGFLPEPWKGYLALVMRYSRIWTTLSADAMVCVFVLGAAAWLRAA